MGPGDSDTRISSVNDDKRNTRASDRDDDEKSSRVNSTELDSSPISQICSVCHSRFPVTTTGSSKLDRVCRVCRSNKNIRKIRQKIHKRQSEEKAPTPSTSDVDCISHGRSPTPTSPSPEPNVGRGDTQTSTSLLIEVLNREQRRVDNENENKDDDDIKSQGSDSSGSVYSPPPDITHGNRPTRSVHVPSTNPSSSMDGNMHRLPGQEPVLYGQDHSIVNRRPSRQKGTNQREIPVYARKTAAKSGTLASSQLPTPGPTSILSMSRADIQGATALMNLTHDRNLTRSIGTANPAPTQNPERTSHILRNNTYVASAQPEAGPGRENTNSGFVPPPGRVVLPPPRTRGIDYRLQEGSVRSHTHRPVSNPWPADNFGSGQRLTQQHTFMDGGSEYPRPPVGGMWYSTGAPILPPLQFRTNSYNQHRSSVGLVRAPIGSSSRLGNSPWQLAAANQVPDVRMTGTPADRNLDIFYVPNPDGSFPVLNQPISYPIIQATPPSVISPPIYRRPEEDYAGIRMGSEYQERAVEETLDENEQNTVSAGNCPPRRATTDRNQPRTTPHRTTIDSNQPRTTIVIDDDPPPRDETTVSRRSIKWPKDEFVHGFQHS